MKKIVIGIDPGASGGLCIFYPDGKKIAYGAKKEKSYSEILKEVSEYAKVEGYEICAYLEQLSGFQRGRFQMMSRQAFVMGTSYGKIIGAMEALSIPFWTITPQRWQKSLPLHKTENQTDYKRQLSNLAKQRYPQLKPTLQTCDAILIAEYGNTQCN